jgi:deazaflavin-dependent oxidoreductase (nitroreductase family)
MKHRLVDALQKYLLNPPVRLLFAAGIQPPGYALLETTGRRSGKPRRTPVGDGSVDGTFWIVAEHGAGANYVRNLQRDPRVRLKLRRGLRTEWRTGTARVLADDDPHARQRLIARGRPGRMLNAYAVRAMGTQLLTVRVDLDEVARDDEAVGT